MAVVTLTTDWGLRDHYLASFKGRLIRVLPEVQLIDITHSINAYDILQASYILKSAYRQFPEGSVHYSGMTGLPARARPEMLVVQSEGHAFVGIDNGLFSLVLEERPRSIHAIEMEVDSTPSEWTEAAAGCIRSLVRDRVPPPEAKERSAMISTFSAQPMTDADGIRATVIYIDEFQNLVLNVTRELFEKARSNRPFTIEMKRVNPPVQKISKWYNEVEEGEILALFNADGFLEIAMNRSNASGLLGVHLYDTVRISFH